MDKFVVEENYVNAFPYLTISPLQGKTKQNIINV